MSCSGFPWGKIGVRKRKGAFIAWSLQGSAPLSIPAGPLLTLQRCCWVEKKLVYMDIPHSPSRVGRRVWGQWMGGAVAMLTLHSEPPNPTGAPAVQSIFTSTGTLQNVYCKSDCLYIVSEYGFEDNKRTFLFYLLVSQTWRKSWGFQASSAYPPRGCQLFPLEDTPANGCINHICCEQKSTSGFIMPAFRSAKTQRSSWKHKGSYLFLNFTCFFGTMNA